MAKNTDSIEVRATVGYVRVVLALAVVALVRGKSVEKPFEVLRSRPPAATTVAKVLRASAVANAEDNNGLRANNLVMLVDEGPTLLYSSSCKGVGSRINKRMSHTLLLLHRKKA